VKKGRSDRSGFFVFGSRILAAGSRAATSETVPEHCLAESKEQRLAGVGVWKRRKFSAGICTSSCGRSCGFQRTKVS
jgi:hypothetical protein